MIGVYKDKDLITVINPDDFKKTREFPDCVIDLRTNTVIIRKSNSSEIVARYPKEQCFIIYNS